MNRWIASLVVALVAGAVVAGAVGAAPVGTVVAQDDPNASDGGNETDAANGTTDISPGEQLIGVVGVRGFGSCVNYSRRWSRLITALL